jgi:hypothetical protein
MDYTKLLTKEQKEAFRRGDRYYKSPFKKMPTARAVAYATRTTCIYVSTTRSNVHCAMLDSWKSKGWN